MEEQGTQGHLKAISSERRCWWREIGYMDSRTRSAAYLFVYIFTVLIYLDGFGDLTQGLMHTRLGFCNLSSFTFPGSGFSIRKVEQQSTEETVLH